MRENNARMLAERIELRAQHRGIDVLEAADEVYAAGGGSATDYPAAVRLARRRREAGVGAWGTVADAERLIALAEREGLSEQTLAGLRRRRETLAVAVVSEDPEALDESDRLTDLMVREERSVATAESTIGQLDAEIAEGKVACKEAVSAVHRERYRTLRAEHGRVEERAEEAMGALREALRELEGIHGRMVAETQRTDEALGASVAEQLVHNMVRSWLGARLSGYGVPTTAASPLYGAPLPKADDLATAPE